MKELTKEVFVPIFNEIYDIVTKDAERGDVREPLDFIYTFLFYFAQTAMVPGRGYNMSRQNMIDIFTIYHEDLIKKLREHDHRDVIVDDDAHDNDR